MKKNTITLIILLISNLTFACSCKWGGNFIRTAKNAELVIMGKVTSRTYHLENGKIFKDFDKLLNEIIWGDYKYPPDYYESIELEILEIIKGKESRKSINIFASDSSDCRSGVAGFKIGKTYILTPTSSKFSLWDVPNEKETDFFLWGCSETSIEYKSESNMVYGLIKGKSNRKKPIEYEYKKLIKKITLHNKV